MERLEQARVDELERLLRTAYIQRLDDQQARVEYLEHLVRNANLQLDAHLRERAADKAEAYHMVAHGRFILLDQAPQRGLMQFQKKKKAAPFGFGRWHTVPCG